MQRLCGWCETPNVGEQTNCINCGGPLPLPPGPDPGPAPPRAPRALPASYQRGLFLNFMVVFGSIFSGMGLLITVGFCVGTLFVPALFFAVCFGSFFVVFGGVFMAIGITDARTVLRVLKHGQPTSGRVTDVQGSGQLWTLTYVYDVGDGALGGSVQVQDPIVSQYKEGDPLHVVYDPAEPSKSSLWPPMKLAV